MGFGGLGNSAASTGLDPLGQFDLQQGLVGTTAAGSAGSGSSGAIGTNVPWMGTGVRNTAVDQQLQRNASAAQQWLSAKNGGSGGQGGSGSSPGYGPGTTSVGGDFSDPNAGIG